MDSQGERDFLPVGLGISQHETTPTQWQPDRLYLAAEAVCRSY